MAPAVVVPGLTYVAGDKINIRFVVDGIGTTALKVKVWAAGTSEPAAWLVNTTDSTADFQSAGTVGLMAYLATNVKMASVRGQMMTLIGEAGVGKSRLVAEVKSLVEGSWLSIEDGSNSPLFDVTNAALPPN